MIILSSKGIFHSTRYESGKSLVHPTKVTNVIPFMYDSMIVEQGTKFKHVFDYLIVPYIAFIETVFRSVVGDSELQKFVDEMKIQSDPDYEVKKDIDHLFVGWTYMHSCDGGLCLLQSEIFPQLKAKPKTVSKTDGIEYFSVSFTPLFKLANFDFMLNERQEILDHDNKLCHTSLRMFTVADIIYGVLEEICEFKNPEERAEAMAGLDEAFQTIRDGMKKEKQ